MPRLTALLIALACAGCSPDIASGPVVSHYLFVQYTKAPDPGDAIALREHGGDSVELIPIAKAAFLKTDGEGMDLTSLDGVSGVTDLGTLLEAYSVYIPLQSAPTADDLAFVRAASGRPAYVTSGNAIATVMKLADVQLLAQSARIGAVTIDPVNLHAASIGQ
ncbi:MAG TPA: hypothetical protein VGM77_06195 [Gemmatimonadales bacterium]|jgi:hypothetical protein